MGPSKLVLYKYLLDALLQSKENQINCRNVAMCIKSVSHLLIFFLYFFTLDRINAVRPEDSN